MEKEVTGSRDFLDEILISAGKEAEQILLDAQAKAESRKKAAQNQEKSFFKDKDSQLERERVRQVKRADQKISSEIRRKELQLRDKFMTEALEKTRRTLIEMTGTDDYNAILSDWVIEVALGLDVPQVELNGTVRERNLMTPDWLKEREKILQDKYGRDVIMSLSDDSPLIQPGVLGKQKDGRLVFNNQLDTRILRKQSELRRVIYQELFEE